MNKTLTPKDILVYYDGPQLFVGTDQVGARYICLLAESIDTHELFLCVPISAERLSNFVVGRVDLLDIFKEPETGEIYSAKLTDNTTSEVLMEIININTIPAEWFPEKGFFFEKESLLDDEIVQEACSKNKGIIYLGLNPPESRGEEVKIDIMTLADSLKLFQQLVKYAQKKSLTSLKPETRKLNAAADNYELELYDWSSGSFKLHLQTKVSGDLGGYSEIHRAMQKIDELMQAVENPENALEILKRNKGHLIGSFKKFLAMIIEKDIPLYYEWTTPRDRKSIKKSISKESATIIYEMLNESKELETEQKEFLGKVKEVDYDKGHWAILNEEDNKRYSGWLDKTLPVDLSGIIIVSKRYKFICEERIEEETVSEKEKSKLFLISHEEA